jgi:hypothetical protein
MPTSNSIHKDLLTTIELLYSKHGFNYTTPVAETESAEYGACTFTVNGRSVKYRAAKITPTKTGQFVTLWKRIDKGPIQPFDISDNIDSFIISTARNENLGHFVFPKNLLLEKKILSGGNSDGKRAIRVYPPWDIPTSRQAEKNQQWQLPYFLETPKNNPIDMIQAERLYQNL